MKNGLKEKLDVSIYARPEFSADQMKYIYSAYSRLKKGLDTSIYKGKILSIRDEYYNSKEEILNSIEKIKKKIN